MSFVLCDKSISQIPSSNGAISWSTGKEASSPGKTTNSSSMTIKLCNFFPFDNIKNFDFAKCISNRNFVILAKSNRTKVIINLACFIKLCHFWRATRPYVKWWIKCNCYLVVIWPIKQIQVKIILKVRSLQHFVWLLTYFSLFLLTVILFSDSLGVILFRCFTQNFRVVRFPKAHDLIGKVRISWLKNIFL